MRIFNNHHDEYVREKPRVAQMFTKENIFMQTSILYSSLRKNKVKR